MAQRRVFGTKFETRGARKTKISTITDQVARGAWTFFESHTNPQNGLVRDASRRDSPASIAATGFGLTAIPVAIENGWLKRADGEKRALTTLRFLENAPQSQSKNASGFRGFFYHFLDFETGLRAWKSELSSIDTALLLAGCLTAGAYFGGETRERAQILFERADWKWMCGPNSWAINHAWKPERIRKNDGFSPYHWRGFNEALLLYRLALVSPTHPIGRASLDEWLSTYRIRTIYNIEHLYAPSLFEHFFPLVWFREWHDGSGVDYFSNTQKAIEVQREYAKRNPRGWQGYDENAWGLSACDGPSREFGPQFRAYASRGVPFGPDDGTLCPPAVAACLPFAPEIVESTLSEFAALGWIENGVLLNSVNPTLNWKAPRRLGVLDGPVVAMWENARSGLIWEMMREVWSHR